MKWISRRILRHAITYHENMRDSILYVRNQGIQVPPQNGVCTDDLWNRAAAELRCADRLRKLLTKYQ